MDLRPDLPRTRHDYRDGDLVLAKDGTRYRLTDNANTIVHETPKVRGKAARRADKRRRRLARVSAAS